MNEEREIFETYACACCGVVLEPDYNDTVYETVDGEHICEKCRDDYYVTCEDCGKLVHLDDVIEVENRYVCPSCIENDAKYFCCDDCGQWFHTYSTRYPWRRNYRETWDNDRICMDCFFDGYAECCDCGEIHPSDDMEEIDGEWYCQKCFERNRRRIHEYGYKPEPEFKSIHDRFFDRFDSDKLYFGCELEVDDGNDRDGCAYDLTAITEDIYCKTDNSLHRGIEIVTHPATLDYHTELLPWAKICSTAEKYGFKSHNTSTCGLHVHVGNDGLGHWKDQMNVKAKIVMIVNRHWDNIVKFTRRKASELNHWACRPNFKFGEDGKETMSNALDEENQGRYRAVNLTNDCTVEFRIFKGTLKPETIIASIQLVSNICHYAMDKEPDDIMKSQWLDIAMYKSYPQLEAYLKERKIYYVDSIFEDQYITREKLELGMRVRVKGFSDIMPETGIVAEVCGDMVGIDFGEGFNGNNLNGTLTNGTGLYLWRGDFEIIHEEVEEECA